MKLFLKNIICLLVWVYLVIKIFWFDIERELMKNINFENHWILNYRFLIILIFFSLIWYFLGHLRFWKYFTFLIFYPIILMFWILPKFFLWKIPKKMHAKKSWLLMYVYLNIIINNVFLLRFNLLTLGSLLLAIVFINNSKNSVLLISSFAIFSLIGIFHLINRFRLAFSPIRMFRINLQLLSMKNGKNPEFIENTISSYNKTIEIEKNNLDKIEQKKIDTIQTLVLTYKFYDFISKRLLEFKNIRLYMGISLLKVLYTFIFILFILSLINYTLFLINSDNFLIIGFVNYFDFIYYSFHSMLLNSVNTIQPISILAKILNMIGPFIGIIITIFLIAIYMSAKSERYRENIDDVVTSSTYYVSELEKTLRQTFNKDVMEAIITLKLAKSSLYNMLFDSNFFKDINELNDSQSKDSIKTNVTIKESLLHEKPNEIKNDENQISSSDDKIPT